MQHTYRSIWRVYFLALNTSLGYFTQGWALTYLNVGLSSLNERFDVEHKTIMASLINGILPLGATLGAMANARLTQYMTLKGLMVATDLLSMISMVIGCIDEKYLLFGARLLIGFSVGLNAMTITAYNREFTPLELRQSVITLEHTMQNMGMLAVFLMDLALVEMPDYWILIYLIPVKFCLIRSLLLMLVFNDETPTHFLNIGDENKTIKVLAKIYKADYVQDRFLELQRDSRRHSIQKKKYDELFRDMFTRLLRFGNMVAFFQQSCGISMIYFYSSFLFEYMGMMGQQIATVNSLVGVCLVIFAFVGGFMGMQRGRKTILYLSYSVNLFALVGAVCFYTLQELSDRTSNYVFSIVFLSLMIVCQVMVTDYASEGFVWDLIPETKLHTAYACQWASLTIFATVIPIVSEYFHVYTVFAMFGVMTILGIILFALQSNSIHRATLNQPDLVFPSFTPRLLEESSTNFNNSDQDGPKQINR